MPEKIKTTPSDMHGFTLIEILAAIFIFSLLLATLFGSFQVLSSSSDTLGRGTVQFQMGQQCISRMVSDIEAIYVGLPPAYTHPEVRESTDPYRIEGDTRSLDGHSFARMRFTSLAHISFSGGQREGVAEIVYYVHSLQDGGYVLRRSDTLYPYDDFEEKDSDPIVCRDIQGFSITYFDATGEDTEAWDSESSESDYATPRSVGIVLQIGEEETPLVFNTRVYIPVYRENQVS